MTSQFPTQRPATKRLSGPLGTMHSIGLSVEPALRLKRASLALVTP
jgi:hypothetical protein